MRSVAGALIVLLSASACSRNLSAPEQIVEKVTKKFGPFDEVRWSADSLTVDYTYLGKDLERAGRIKEIIDKALNQDGIEHRTSSEVENIIGVGTFYFWGTPEVKVELYPIYFNTFSDRTKLFIVDRRTK